MRRIENAAIACAGALLVGCAAVSPPPSLAVLQQQVAAAETAFAKTMADRNHAAFATFLADDTVFFSGPKPLHGKAAVAAFWQRFYEKPEAPFSWKPEQVEVLDSGTLAISTGPVFAPGGKQIATFTSVWRLESGGVWRIVFDKGNDFCDCPKP
jgi:ketosteroid isomerase-like protein